MSEGIPAFACKYLIKSQKIKIGGTSTEILTWYLKYTGQEARALQL
jgi:hypothetical protein